MKKTTVLFIAILLVIGLVVGGCAKAPAPEEFKPINLMFNSWCPNDIHPLNRHIQTPWADQVEQRTGGRVKVTMYLNSVLCKEATTFDAVQAGMADVSNTIPTDPKRFPLTQIVSLPFIYSSGESATRAFMELWEKYPQFSEEYKDFKVLVFGTNAVANLFGPGDEPIKTLEDFQGTLCAGWGAHHPLIQILGAQPVSTDATERYSQFEKKMVDSMMEHFGWFMSAHFEEVTKWVTFGLAGPASPIQHVMNLDVWNSLPPDIQEIIDDISAPMWVNQAKAFDDNNVATEEFLKTEYPEVTLYYMTDEEKARWIEAASPLWDAWVKNVTALGYPGQQMLDDYVQLCNKYNKIIEAEQG